MMTSKKLNLGSKQSAGPQGQVVAGPAVSTGPLQLALS